MSNDDNGENLAKTKEETQSEIKEISLDSQPTKFKAAKKPTNIRPEKGEIIYIIH